MVSIKKNNKGELKEATGLRTRKTSIYIPGQNETFKISRSKFSNFMDCKRCFYLDRVKGLQEPSMPGWALNTSVDELLKKEFDYYRERKEPHPIFKEYNLTNLENYRDPKGKLALNLGVVGLPYSIIISRDRKDVGRLIGPIDWSKKEVENLFLELIVKQE